MFDGRPGNYREFRRKTILAVAGLEEKHVHLAGPRLLTRLQGEAYRATEHLSVADLRRSDGWMQVIRALDAHYAFLPETELHEAIDHFLFDLRKRPHEGATAFASRFKTALARVQALIAQDRKAAKAKKPSGSSKKSMDSPAASSVEFTDEDAPSDDSKSKKKSPSPSPAEPAGAAGQPSTPAPKAAAASPGGEHDEPRSARSQASSEHGSRRRHSSKGSRGTHEGDRKAEHLRMAHMLGTIEIGHTKPSPIFPSTVLGHLFMRKYGLSREQRAQVIRATGGSSRFQEIERILRASDFDESRGKQDDRRHGQGHPSRTPRREALMVQQHEAHAIDDDSSDIPEPMTSGSDSNDALAVDQQPNDDDSNDDDDTERELQEIYEVKQKAKRDFKKSFRTYKDSRKRVKEIKKARQPYYPVVALSQPQDQSASGQSSVHSSQLPKKSDFKYDKNRGSSKSLPPKRKPGDGKPRREDANFAEAEMSSHFAYVVTGNVLALETTSLDVLLASIPDGCAIVDTGCTTSVIGHETAVRFIQLFQSLGLPAPAQCQLPAVELKGFSGDKKVTTKGLRWTVKIGNLWGTVTTYVVEGPTPFLLSRRVLEGMEATLNLGNATISSKKHGMVDVPLKRAANGHLLLPFCEVPTDFQLCSEPPTADISIADAGDIPGEATSVSSVDDDETPQPPAVNHEPNAAATANPAERQEPAAVNKPHSPNPTKNRRQNIRTRMQLLQHIAKNTRQGIVNLDRFRQDMIGLIGSRAAECTHAFIAYRPRLERIPIDAHEKPYLSCQVTLSSDGDFEVKPWSARPPGADRNRVPQTNLAMFAYIPLSEPAPHRETVPDCHCLCCSEVVDSCMEVPKPPMPELEQMYEETDWASLQPNELQPEQRQLLSDAIKSVRKVNTQLTLSKLYEDPDAVIQELRTWLGPQAKALDTPVHFIEVFTDKAPLGRAVSKHVGKTSILLGINHGQDFNRARDRRLLMCLIALTRPDHVWFSFPCGCWGPWSRFNLAKGDPSRSTVLQQRKLARRHLSVVSEAWQLQCLIGGHCHAENPLTSEAWSELNLGEVFDVRIDMCSLGLRCPKSNVPVLKPTLIVTTMQELYDRLRSCRCDGKHVHAHLEGKFKGRNLSSWCEVYPNKFCRVVSETLSNSLHSPVTVAEILFDEAEALEPLPDGIQDSEGAEPDLQLKRLDKVKAIVQKLHVNTGHASVEQMLRLAKRCQSSSDVIDTIKAFRCPVCEELKVPGSHRQAAMPHAEKPNEIVGLDYVQVELKREDDQGKLVEDKFNVLTVVCLATGFAQQIICPTGHSMSTAFHEVWSRPYGLPKTVYMDPAMANVSKEFQRYLAQNDIRLLLAAAESHWQLGLVEVTNRILRHMAQKVWKTTKRPAKEVIEMCASTRNEQLRRCGFSPSQWFLGQDSRQVGLLRDLDEQHNIATASQIIADPDFYEKVRLREQAAIAFHEEHAKDVWRRAVGGKVRPMKGPYQIGQLVYVFRKRARGLLSTRHGVWIGPGRVVGLESESGGPVPRVVWVSFNGYLYRCSPEGLRPIPEDEAEFRDLARSLSEGRLHPAIEQAEQSLSSKAGQYEDLIKENEPRPEDHDLEDDLWDEPMLDNINDELDDERPRKIRRRIYKSPEYWQRRSEGAPPLGALHEDEDMPQVITLKPSRPAEPMSAEEPAFKRQVTIDSVPEELAYEPGTPVDSDQQSQVQAEPVAVPDSPDVTVEEPQSAPSANADDSSADVEMQPHEIPVPDDDELILEHEEHMPVPHKHDVMEVSIELRAEDITDSPLCLWEVLEDCFTVQPAAKQRRVEVNFRKLSPEDKAKFEVAMKKEWQSWIDNKVTSLCKSRGIPRERVIRARWVLVWKKSSDPDNREKTPKARLVLVGWQDPELGHIATDSPTLKKESKNLILSICAARKWKIWGADIKTAFLSGDPSDRQLYFRPPAEIQKWMELDKEDLFRLEKAAYGLAEAPRAWFLRLSRELKAQGLRVSQLDRCLFTLRNAKNELIGVCGVHVDDLLGGGTPEMDAVLTRLRKCLPFGDFRTFTIRYTGIEIRQNPNTFAIEIGQETYIDSLQPVPTKQLGSSGTPVKDVSLLRRCAGQLAWAAGATRPDKAFLASYLQGVQDKATVSHVEMFNKAVREMKERKITMKFPSNVPIEDWRLICISDAGHAKRANGDSQGGYLLGLTNSLMRDRKFAPMWLVDWASKKLKRVVRSSTAAETHAGNDALDAIEFFQSLMAETLYGVVPREFRKSKPKHVALLVVDSRGFYDATSKLSSASTSQEKKLEIEYAIARDAMARQNIEIYWINNIYMAADILTKLNSDVKPFFDLMESGKYQIKVCKMSGSKEKAIDRKHQGDIQSPKK